MPKMPPEKRTHNATYRALKAKPFGEPLHVLLHPSDIKRTIQKIRWEKWRCGDSHLKLSQTISNLNEDTSRLSFILTEASGIKNL